MVKEAQSQKEDAVARALAQAHKQFEHEVLVLRSALHKLKMQVCFHMMLTNRCTETAEGRCSGSWKLGTVC
jgi:hypothetical protein